MPGLRRDVQGDSRSALVPATSDAAPDSVCLMTQGGQTAEVFTADGQRLGTLGSDCLWFSGTFGQTYTLTIHHDAGTFAHPVTITNRRAWTVQLP